MKRSALSLLLLGLVVLALGCGSSGGGGGGGSFSDPHTLDAVLSTMSSFSNSMDAASPIQGAALAAHTLGLSSWQGPYTSDEFCEMDGQEYTLTYYYRTDVPAAPVAAAPSVVTVQYYSTSNPDHGGSLGSEASPCTETITVNSETSFNVNYVASGISGALHPPVTDYTLTFGGPITGSESAVSINLTGNYTINLHSSGASICTGTLSFIGEISETAFTLRYTMTANDSSGGRIEMTVDPTDASISSHTVNGQPAVGKIVVTGTTSYNNTYYFNADGDFDPPPPWVVTE